MNRGTFAVDEAVPGRIPPGIAAVDGRVGEENRDGRAAIEANCIQPAREISSQARDGVESDMLSSSGLCEIAIQGAIDKDLVVRGPAVAKNRRAVGLDLKGIRSAGINGPEVSSAHKSNFVAPQMTRTAGDETGQ